MMHRIRFSLFATLALTVTLSAIEARPAFADPAKVQEELRSTLATLEKANKQQEKREKEAKNAEKELENLQERLVKIAKKLRREEEKLARYEEKQAILKQEYDALNEVLTARRAELGEVVQAMVRLSMTPEQAVVAMPGDFHDTLRTAKGLELASTKIKEEADELKKQLEQLEWLQQKISANQEKLQASFDRHAEERKELESELEKRQQLMASLHKESKEEKSKLADLTKRSRNLKELLSSLERHREEFIARDQALFVRPVDKPAAPARPAAETEVASLAVNDAPIVSVQRESTPRQPAMPFAKMRGRLPLPAAGTVISRFGQKDGSEVERGLRIRTRSHAEVTTPSGGEVVYTGPFMDYGNMVIVRHDGGYHTLLAGMAEVSCSPGQRLLAGEPVGTMGGEAQPELYMELRQNGKPINPGSWLVASAQR